jgi:hypothetical protein
LEYLPYPDWNFDEVPDESCQGIFKKKKFFVIEIYLN